MIRKSGKQRHRAALWRKCRTLRSLKQIHALMVVRRFLDSDLSDLRELLFSASISIPGALGYAHKLFDRIPQPDLFMWNTIIRASSHGPTPSDAIALYSRMRSGTNPFSPSIHTFPFLLKACSRLSCPSAGHQFHARIVKAGLESTGFVRNALINFNANCGDLSVADGLFVGPARNDAVAWSAMIAGYARRGALCVARQLFEESPSKDLISWNVMITAYVKWGKMESARELFDRVPDRDVVSWNAMISGYAKCGLHDKAMELFDEMRALGVRPDEVTMLSLLSACADSGELDAGERLHRSLLDMCMAEGGVSLFHGNTLIDMYAKCGRIDKALDIFRGMRERDISTWNAIIGGLAFHGHAEECIRNFTEMLRERVRPNEITFVGVLAACSHGGMVEAGRRYFSLMRNVYSIVPNIKHYGCMVDMLGRAGLLEEAFEFVEGMEVEPNHVVWRTLLGACRLHGNAELGEHANEQLLRLGHDASGDYILLSNIYAEMGEWDGAEKVRKLMDERGVPKEAGCSLVGGQDEKFTPTMVIPVS